VTTHEVLVAVVPAALVLGAVLWSHIQQRAAIDRLDDRIAHLVAGTALLTDTTEGALRDIANEIGRLAAVTAGSRPSAAADTSRPLIGAGGQRRTSVAGRRGLPKTLRDAAAIDELQAPLDEAPSSNPAAGRAISFRPVRDIAAVEGLSAVDDRTPAPSAAARPVTREASLPPSVSPVAPALPAETDEFAYWN
jgi:hypothetical protein